MEKLTSFIQNILFSRCIEDIKYIKSAFLKDEKSEDFAGFHTQSMNLTEQFGSFHILYQRHIEMRRIDESKLSIEVKLHDGSVKTNGGIYICELPRSIHYYETTL